MPRSAKSNSSYSRRRAPARSLEEREDQLIARAIDLAERQLVEGTASAQVISHFLKLGSTREKLEQERIREEMNLSQAKRENLKSQKKSDELFAKAMRAMTSYRGEEPSEDLDVSDDESD